MSTSEVTSSQTTITLRINGPNRCKITTEVDPTSTTIGDLKQQVSREVALPSHYLKMIARGMKFDDDTATLKDVGLYQNRSSVMCMHNELFANDQKGIAQIQAMISEIENLEGQIRDDSPPKADVVHEVVTQLCCRLDGIETNGSDTLRRFRKQALARAEALDNKYNNETSKSI